MRTSTADELRRRTVLRCLAVTPNAKLSQVVDATRLGRKEASRILDRLIVDDLVRIKRPGLGRFLSALLFTPLGLLFAAERYSLTATGLWSVARDDSEHESRRATGDPSKRSG